MQAMNLALPVEYDLVRADAIGAARNQEPRRAGNRRASAGVRRFIALVGIALFAALPVGAHAQHKLEVTPVVEKKVKRLPPGTLYWHVETLPTLADAQARAAASEFALAAEVFGKPWLFTLGPSGAATPGAVKAAEIGPVPPLQASEYLLRVNQAMGAPGAKTPVHTHPGSEAFYVLTGKLGQRTLHGTAYAEAGQTMNGHGADMPMEVFSAGSVPLQQLVMFVVDAHRPFSSPASFD